MRRLRNSGDRRGFTRWSVRLGSALLLLAATAAVATAQTGTVAGTVTDRTNHAAVPSAQVQIIGTTRGTLTGSDGHYRLAGVSSGPLVLRVTRIGYAAESRTVTVPTGDIATADFTLAPTQVTLDQVVVTGLGTQQRERENGNAVASIVGDSVSKAAIETFSDLLTAKASNVNITQSSGTIGTGSRIRIRGSNSVTLANDPLLVIDGLQVSNNANSFSDQFSVGGQTPSRFDDLNPEDIETIEVLKGPAASALYGTAGANGVILVTMKKGLSGRTQWNAHGEYGQVSNAAKFPTNFGQLGTIGGKPTSHCTIVAQAVGTCTATAPVRQWNPLASHQFSPFSTNNPRQAMGASVAGGSDVTKYYVSGDYDNIHGVYPNNFQTKNNARADIQSAPSPTFDFGINAGYLQSRAQLPQNDNNQFSPLASGYLGSSSNAGTQHGYLLVTPGVANNLLTYQNVERFTGGANGNWRPLNWLTISGVSGIDFTDRQDRFVIPPGILNPNLFFSQANGQATSNPFQIWSYTTQGTAAAQYDVSSSIHGTSTIGTQYTNQQTRGTFATGLQLIAGTGSVAGTTSQFVASEVGNRQVVTVGFYGQQQLSWRDRLFLTAALRSDDASAFGQNFKLDYYPSVSGSWVIGEEPWFPKGAVVSSFRLRSAFGYSGLHPNFQQAQTFFVSSSYHNPLNGVANEGGGFLLGGIGNVNLKPERSHEAEAGFDAGLFRDRLNLTLTGYAKATDQALIAVNLPVSGGGVQTGAVAGTATAFRNIGSVTNRGIEIGLTSVLIEGRNTRLDLTVNASMNHNKLITLGNNPPINVGLSSISGQFIQQQTPGYPLASFFQQSYTYSDKNHDGVITPDEVTVATASTYKGNPFPNQLVSIAPSLTLFRYFKLSTLIDDRTVAYSFDGTRQFRCSLFQLRNCQQDYDPKTPLKDQAVIAADAAGTDAGFIENAGFLKWRELSLTMTAPDRWASLAHVRALSFTVAGRNLRTWTKFKGVDPEVNFNGSDNFTVTDFFTQPLVRYWTGRVNISF